MSILYGNSITKKYVSQGMEYNAINGIDLTVETGEFVGVMGPSGSGKTTLLNLLSGIDYPTTGAIEIQGQNICSLKDDDLAVFRRQKIGFVLQDFSLLDSLTIKENIMLPMTLERKNVREIDRKVHNTLRILNIFEIANKYPFETSGGQQQRTAIGRALINDPAIIFADEPTGNLDSKSSNSIMTYFEKINKEKSCTIFMVTHDAFAASFCNRIIFIKDGCINSQMIKDCERKEFLGKILTHLLRIGGETNDI